MAVKRLSCIQIWDRMSEFCELRAADSGPRDACEHADHEGRLAYCKMSKCPAIRRGDDGGEDDG
jgi:hypothetical protein